MNINEDDEDEFKIIQKEKIETGNVTYFSGFKKRKTKF